MSTISTDYSNYLSADYLAQNPQVSAFLQESPEFAETLGTLLQSLDASAQAAGQENGQDTSAQALWDQLNQSASVTMSWLGDLTGTSNPVGSEVDTSSLFLPSRVIEAGYEPGMEAPEGMWLQTWSDDLNRWVDDDLAYYQVSEDGQAQVSYNGQWEADTSLHRLVGAALELTSQEELAANPSAATNDGQEVAFAAGQDPPQGMIREYWDQAEGRWRPDLQPHRMTEDGGEEYFFQGQWHADEGLHRWAVPTTESVEAAYDLAAQQVAVQFYDTETGSWMTDTCPHRRNQDGVLEYFDQGQWLTDNQQHRVFSDDQGWVASNELGQEQILASAEALAAAQTEDAAWDELVAGLDEEAQTSTTAQAGASAQASTSTDQTQANYTQMVNQEQALAQDLQA